MGYEFSQHGEESHGCSKPSGYFCDKSPPHTRVSKSILGWYGLVYRRYTDVSAYLPTERIYVSLYIFHTLIMPSLIHLQAFGIGTQVVNAGLIVCNLGYELIKSFEYPV